MALDVVETTSTATTSSIGVDENTDVHQIATGVYDISNTNNITSVSNGFSDYAVRAIGDFMFEQCGQRQPLQHKYFQLANALFLLAFCLPHGSYSLLCARTALVLGSILMTMWGYFIECRADTIFWSSLFIVINVIYLFLLIYRLRPIRFEKEIEAVRFFLSIFLSILFFFIFYYCLFVALFALIKNKLILFLKR